MEVEILLVSKQIPQEEKALIERVLTEHHVDLHSVLSYKKAIEKLARHRFAIVILYCFSSADDLSAAEAVRIMKEIVPTLLIIAISGDTPLETERELRKSGLYFYMTSPFEEAEFRDVFSGVMRKEMIRRRK